MSTHGFIRVATACPQVQVANTTYNAQNIMAQMSEAVMNCVSIICFPELVLTASTCGNLFHQQQLINTTSQSLRTILNHSATLPIIAIIGCPIFHKGRLYNCAVVIEEGRIKGIVPQSIATSSYFAPAHTLADDEIHECFDTTTPFGANLLFETPYFTFAIELGDDALAPCPPSASLCLAGAEVIFNPSSRPEIANHTENALEMIKQQSKRCLSGYVSVGNGFGESTQDAVYAGRGVIAECGEVLSELPAFGEGLKMTFADVDVQRIRHKRFNSAPFTHQSPCSAYRTIKLNQSANTVGTQTLQRPLPTLPFLPQPEHRASHFEHILNIQVEGLAKRIVHTHAKTAIIGVSGGLDSTLALLVAVRCFDRLNKPRTDIVGVTMPGFGTTGRTYANAIELMKQLGITIREISIKSAVEQHFKDIDHNIGQHDVTYENSQARERTQILMDIANQMNGMVIGTGDLSELALGWATYNGDHMSMYGVNASIPKTMMRFLVKWIASTSSNAQVQHILLDVVDTPVSPELMPADNQGNIKQKTEDLVGPYELHDFFIFHTLTNGYTPEKIFKLACQAFESPTTDTEAYDSETIKKWLLIFCRRFFNQQFKRSCLPDGPQATVCSLSPRTTWHMPSDADSTNWKF
ncbi:MAG: NAD(+) synthase [Bacteroidaceae bacterium]|nr:NAD(+) synthase [Bacteroidaceae bacterium]